MRLPFGHRERKNGDNWHWQQPQYQRQKFASNEVKSESCKLVQNYTPAYAQVGLSLGRTWRMCDISQWDWIKHVCLLRSAQRTPWSILTHWLIFYTPPYGSVDWNWCAIKLTAGKTKSFMAKKSKSYISQKQFYLTDTYRNFKKYEWPFSSLYIW